MHELAIAQRIMESVMEEKDRLGLENVHGVAVRVGALSGVLADSLRFCYDALCVGTTLEACRLHIEEVPVSVRCRDCTKVAVLADFVFICPDCLSKDVEMETGYELDIAWLDVPDGAPI